MTAILFCIPAFHSSAQVLSADRQQILDAVRENLDKNQPVPNALLASEVEGPWTAVIQAYRRGEVLFSAEAAADTIAAALGQSAAEAALKKEVLPAADNYRLFISLKKGDGSKTALVEYQGRALEVAGEDLVALRRLDKDLIRTKIQAAKNYLMKAMDPQYHGFYKKYDALRDKSEKQLRTIYTASSLWTLLKLSDMAADPVITERIPQIAGFLLSMQVPEGPMKGAFYYSLSLKDGGKKSFVVVGTASKTIFTLLELYRRYKDPKYLEAAQNAGDWLLTTQKPDGTLTTSFRFVENEWQGSKGFSTLYHGQVLSALSRLYGVTNDEKYLSAAARLAEIMMTRAEEQNYFLRDDYRLSEDPVPTSWGIMSLLDYYKVTAKPEAKEAMISLTRELIKHQHAEPGGILNYGRFEGSTASSGNGWINEVFSELYLYGETAGLDEPEMERIKLSILRVTRWLVQNTYSAENSFRLKNPERAIGGLIRNSIEESVRTDAVCHGVNGYINMLPEWAAGTLLEIPE